MARGEEAHPTGEGKHPLAHRHGGEDVADQVIGAVLHPAGGARRTDVRFAGEGHEPLETAAGTADSDEAPDQDSASHIGTQVALDEGGDAAAVRAALAGRREKRLQPLADNGVEERLLRLPPAVTA